MSAICDAHKKNVGVELLYVSAQEVQLESWRSNEFEIRCGRENQHPERLGPRVPGWAAQENGKETRLWPIEWGGVNMLQFCSVSHSLSHTTLSIKWEVYFLRNCVARLYCVVVMILHACTHRCLYSWLWLYKTCWHSSVVIQFLILYLWYSFI